MENLYDKCVQYVNGDNSVGNEISGIYSVGNVADSDWEMLVELCLADDDILTVDKFISIPDYEKGKKEPKYNPVTFHVDDTFVFTEGNESLKKVIDNIQYRKETNVLTLPLSEHVLTRQELDLLSSTLGWDIFKMIRDIKKGLVLDWLPLNVGE